MAPTQAQAGSLEGMETRQRKAAQPDHARHLGAGGDRMVALGQGLLARLGLPDPHPRPTERLLGRTGPEGVQRPLPAFPGCIANRRMRTRTSGGVGGAGVSPAPTRSILLGWLARDEVPNCVAGRICERGLVSEIALAVADGAQVRHFTIVSERSSQLAG
jgi:hypothetical protein